MLNTKFLIIPSPLIMAATYQPLENELSTSFNVETLELPGSGFHFSKKRIWTMEDYAKWVLQEMNRRHVTQAILVAHSNSGAIAMEVARMAAGRIQGIIFADSTGVVPQPILTVLGGRAWDALLELGLTLKATPQLLWNALFHPINFFFQVYAAIRMRFIHHMKDYDNPVLAVWGMRDHTMPPTQSEEFRANVPQAMMYYSHTGSHDWLLTQPREFHEVVKFWMAQEFSKRRTDRSRSSELPRDFQ